MALYKQTIVITALTNDEELTQLSIDLEEKTGDTFLVTSWTKETDQLTPFEMALALDQMNTHKAKEVIKNHAFNPRPSEPKQVEEVMEVEEQVTAPEEPALREPTSEEVQAIAVACNLLEAHAGADGRKVAEYLCKVFNVKRSYRIPIKGIEGMTISVLASDIEEAKMQALAVLKEEVNIITYPYDEEGEQQAVEQQAA